MTIEWEEGSYWCSLWTEGEHVSIYSHSGSLISFYYLSEPGHIHETSKPVFVWFFRRLEPEEEGLMLLSRLDK